VTVVLDSGIWISGFQFEGTPLAALDQAFIYDQIAICDEIITEVSVILASKFGWSESDFRSAFQGYLAEAKRIPIKGVLTGVCRDPKDDMLFECALRARAKLIISGDKDVLEVGEYKGIRVVTARQYVAG
jgi:putative PIN family toxin of toxin-antitoxin system